MSKDTDFPVHMTDLGNSVRLIRAHGDNICYCYQTSKWHIWDSRRWAIDTRGRIEDMAKDTVLRIFHELPYIESSTDRAALAKHATISESNGRIKAMISLARSARPVELEKLDRKPWLLNVNNGTLNLKIGKLEPHSKEDYLTKCIPLDYYPGLECPKWLGFLNKIMGGKETLVNFIQRCIGYSLSGSVQENCFFILHGSGSNGKTTFIEVIRHLLGDYAKQADFSTFLAQKFDPATRSDLVRLKGSRFVAAAEAEEGKKLGEVLLKTLSGGDVISARSIYQEHVEFVPECKIWLISNHKPTVTGTEHAIWRRIKFIPFGVTIKGQDLIPDYAQVLVRDELLGILSWAVEGTRLWLETGLQEPLEVTAATAAYRDEMDILGDFISDVCDLTNPKEKVGKGEFYGRYQRWCEDSQTDLLSQRAFGARLRERGMKEVRWGRTRYWSGIQIIG